MGGVGSSMRQLELGGSTGGAAVLSECGLFRYSLSRVWPAPLGIERIALFIMLNPSKADASVDDHTIRKCIGFARLWGFAGIEVVNLFALRSTKPKGLLAVRDPVGPDNDAHILRALERARSRNDAIVVAWGAHKHPLMQARVDWLREAANECSVTLECLGRSLDGSPRHPLMLAYDTPKVPW